MALEELIRATYARLRTDSTENQTDARHSLMSRRQRLTDFDSAKDSFLQAFKPEIVDSTYHVTDDEIWSLRPPTATASIS